MSLQFDETFGKFKSEEDKFESLYIFVIRSMTIENVINELKRMISTADEIANNVKKNYIKARLYSFVTYLERGDLETTISGIYMIYKKIEEFSIIKEWDDTLNMFRCKNFVCEYGDKFKLDWLRNYLTDKSYLNVFHIQNNNIKHIFLNSTKRVVNSEHDEKNCKLLEFIEQRVQKNEYSIVHGTSSYLKQLKDTTTLKVLTGTKKDDEIFEEYEKIMNEKKSKELQKWLDLMQNPDSKEAKKIVFGKEIMDAINDRMLKTLFCTPRIKKFVFENFEQDALIFDIVEIKSYDQSDIGTKLKKDFNGSIGIKFY